MAERISHRILAHLSDTRYRPRVPRELAEELAEYAEACGRTLALAHSRGDRRSFRFEQAVVNYLPKVMDELVQACVDYAEQQKMDCELLGQLVGQSSDPQIETA